jgi:hypothetical protein
MSFSDNAHKVFLNRNILEIEELGNQEWQKRRGYIKDAIKLNSLCCGSKVIE